MGNDLTRVTFNLNQHGDADLDYIQNAELINRTDAIHRALRLYTFMLKAQAEGQDIILRDQHGQASKVTWA